MVKVVICFSINIQTTNKGLTVEIYTLDFKPHMFVCNQKMSSSVHVYTVHNVFLCINAADTCIISEYMHHKREAKIISSMIEHIFMCRILHTFQDKFMGV